MSGNQFGIVITLCITLTLLALIRTISNSYKNYSKIHPRNSKRKNMKITIKDFLNSEGSPRNPFVLLLAMILAIILGPFVFAGIYLFKLLPLVVLQFLIIMLGFIVFIYFVIMVKDTAKSIKKEKFKTTIKTRVDGFVVLSIFMFCIFAYVYKT